jgi:hypothetical protein
MRRRKMTIMVNLAELCNAKNTIAWKFSDELKAFCEKYQISPYDLKIEYTGAGLSIKVIV